MPEAMDHWIIFSFAIALLVAFWFAVLRWAFKAANVPGAANLFGG